METSPFLFATQDNREQGEIYMPQYRNVSGKTVVLSTGAAVYAGATVELSEQLARGAGSALQEMNPKAQLLTESPVGEAKAEVIVEDKPKFVPEPEPEPVVVEEPKKKSTSSKRRKSRSASRVEEKVSIDVDGDGIADFFVNGSVVDE